MSPKCLLRRDSISHLPKLLANESWYKRVKRKLKKLLLVSNNHPDVFQHFKSNVSVERECRRQAKDYPGFIIHPLSQFRKFWNIFIFIIMLSHMLLAAFAVGFWLDLQVSTHDKMILIDGVLCSILFLEMVLMFRTGFVEEETNEIILDLNDIANKYLTNFYSDLVCCVPLILFAAFIIEEENGVVNRQMLLYMYCLLGFSFYHFERISFYFSSVPVLLNLSEKSTVVMNICLRSIYILHWVTCIRRLMPHFLRLDPDDLTQWHKGNYSKKFHFTRFGVEDVELVENLLVEDLVEILQNATVLSKYSRTIMVTLKLVLQSGYTAETVDSIQNVVLTTFVMLFGWIYGTYVVIVISNVFMAAANSENRFEEMSNEIDVFCEVSHLSKALKKKIKKFYELKFQGQFFNEDAIRASTPASLRKEIAMHSCAGLISKVPLFYGIPEYIKENIISCLRLEIYFPNDIIIQAGTMVDSMYFIGFGTAAIYSSTGVLIGTICDGSHIGEISLLIKGQKRIASVVAVETCEVYKLNQKDFRKLIDHDSELYRRLEQIALERINIFSRQEKIN